MTLSFTAAKYDSNVLQQIDFHHFLVRQHMHGCSLRRELWEDGTIAIWSEPQGAHLLCCGFIALLHLLYRLPSGKREDDGHRCCSRNSKHSPRVMLRSSQTSSPHLEMWKRPMQCVGFRTLPLFETWLLLKNICDDPRLLFDLEPGFYMDIYLVSS